MHNRCSNNITQQVKVGDLCKQNPFGAHLSGHELTESQLLGMQRTRLPDTAPQNVCMQDPVDSSSAPVAPIPQIPQPFPQVLSAAFAAQPHASAVTHGSHVWSYGQLQKHVLSLRLNLFRGTISTGLQVPRLLQSLLVLQPCPATCLCHQIFLLTLYSVHECFCRKTSAGWFDDAPWDGHGGWHSLRAFIGG